MARDEDKRWRCGCCEEIFLESEWLTTPNPFDPRSNLIACPSCLEVAGFQSHEVCDEPGCNENATCGFPAGDEFGGYRRTCLEHSDFGKVPK